MYIVAHLDDIPLNLLALLPARIRRELLLSLPAVDVCKLEETLVTDGLSMNEVWCTLFNRRMPLEVKSNNLFVPLTCPKESYFEVVFSKAQYLVSIQYARNSSYHNHIVASLLYAVNYTAVINFFSYQGLLKCSSNQRIQKDSKSCLLTRVPYSNILKSSRSIVTDITQIIKLFVDVCHASFKYFPCRLGCTNISKDTFSSSCFQPEFIPYLNWLFNSVTVFDLSVLQKGLQDEKKLQHFSSVIFANCHVETVIFSDLGLLASTPYLVNNPHIPMIKELEFRPFSYDTAEGINDILNYQLKLEKVKISKMRELNFKLSSLYNRPSFSELHLVEIQRIPENIIYDIIYQFFASPYPVTLHIDNVSVTQTDTASVFDVQPHSTQHSKTLVVMNTKGFPIWCLPKFIYLKEFKMDFQSSFPDNFCSIKTDVISLKLSLSSNNIDASRTLIKNISTNEWKLDVLFIESSSDVLEIFAKILQSLESRVTYLKLRVNQDSSAIPFDFGAVESSILSLYSSLPYMELDLNGCGYNDTRLNEFHRKWELSGSIKFKELNMRKDNPPLHLKGFFEAIDPDELHGTVGNVFYDTDTVANILSKMTIYNL